MRSSAIGNTRHRVIVSERRTCPFALAIFLAAYVGILAVIFAPQGTFVSPPSTAQAGR
ncbi:MAG: hypothetical protein ACXIU8_10690 [Alkalilacustris sp.]